MKKVYKGWCYECEKERLFKWGNKTGLLNTEIQIIKTKKAALGEECYVCTSSNCKPVKVKITVE